MVKVKLTLAAVAVALMGSPFGALAPTAVRADTTPYTVTSGDLNAKHLGPNSDTSCDLVYDLYVPNDASPSRPVPAILATNGFGGSKADQAGEGDLFARHGYEVLSYSGLGFGGSSCKVETDSPEWDGRAASQFVDFLGSRPEVLKKGPGNPVIGTWGGSYGGGFQFALASVDSRIDAMIPLITWNDLSYSLGPNNNAPDFKYDAAIPGVLKAEWSEVFFADGNAAPVLNRGTSGWTNTTGAPFTGTPPNQCPGFDDTVCLINAESILRAYPTADTVAYLRHSSAQYEFFDNPKVTNFPPTLLIQGQTDTLFTMADAVANFRGFKAKGAPVKLVFEAGGHSGPGAPGEVNNQNPAAGYLSQMWLNWYDHYLKHSGVSTGPELEYFRDWVTYDKAGSAAPAYGSSPQYPVAGSQTWYLSADNALVRNPTTIKAGNLSLNVPPLGVVGSYSETSELQNQAPFSMIPPSDLPGTFVTFSTPALTTDLVSVGIPTADFSISTAAPMAPDPSAGVVLFGKIYDVAPDGSISLVHRLVSPIRVLDTSRPVHINLPGVVHKYAAGHRLQLVLASTDQAYTGSRQPNQVSIKLDAAQPATLTIPVEGGDSAAASAPVAAPVAPVTGSPLPNTAGGRSALLVFALLTLLGTLLALSAQRRRGTL